MQERDPGQEKNAVRYEETLYAIENGAEKKRYNGKVITADEVKSWLGRELELIEKAMDKQAYLENCLDALGGFRFSKDNVKNGYIARIGRWGQVEIMSTGPQNVVYKILTGGAKCMCGKASYAEISEIIKAEEKKPDAHPFKVGEQFTAVSRDYSNGLHDVKATEIVYEVIKASDTTIRLKPIGTDEKAITRKPVKTYGGEWRFSIDDTYGNTFYKKEPLPDQPLEQAKLAATVTEERPSALGRLEAVKADVKKIEPPVQPADKLKTKEPEL